MKRGQVTIFIILAIIIVTIIVLGFYFRENVLESFKKEEAVKGIAVSKEIRDVADFLENCIREVGKESLTYIFAQGGLWQPMPYFSQEHLEIGYWYYKGEDNTPSIEEVEKSLADFVDFYLSQCMYEFEKSDMLIIEPEAETKVKVRKEKVIMEVSYPATVAYKDVFYSLPEEPFVIEFESDFKSVYDAGRQVVKMELKNPDYIDATMLIKLGHEVTYLPSGSYEGLYLISGKATNLMFANKFE